MLLRRITESLRSQNWTAVCLDLAIVILGIFLGMQVSQWYENRQEIALADSILDRLQAEFDEISAQATAAVRFHQDEIVALEVVRRSLRNGALAPGDEARFREALRDAMSYELGPSRSVRRKSPRHPGSRSILTRRVRAN